MSTSHEHLLSELSHIRDTVFTGRVAAVQGILVEITGIQGYLSIGDRCSIAGRSGRKIICEIIGFRDERALATPFASLEGVGLGCAVELIDSDPMIYPDESWLGRVINAFAEPVDDKGVLLQGEQGYAVRNPPPVRTFAESGRR